MHPKLICNGKCVCLLYLGIAMGSLNILIFFLKHEYISFAQPTILEMKVYSVEMPIVKTLNNLTKFVSLALVNNDNATLASLEEDIRKFLSDAEVLNRTADCNNYFKHHVQAFPYSSKVNYSIAFSHVMHKQIGIFEMFMATTYRVEDTHCIFIDSKATETFKKAAEGIVKCYNEVFLKDCRTCGSLFLQKGTYPVIWAHVSLLDAHMDCLASALDANKDWKFFINTAGSELPFKPIDELKSIMAKAPGSIVESSYLKQQSRLHKKLILRRSSLKHPLSFSLSHAQDPKLPPPYNLTIQKGWIFVALKRDYANYIVTDPTVLEIYNWMYDMIIPEESFFATLITIDKNENGSLTQDLTKNTTHGLCIRTILWDYANCSGSKIRRVCNLGIHDLKIAKQDNCLIGNKFNLDISASAVLLQTIELFGNNESWAIDVKKIISP